MPLRVGLLAYPLFVVALAMSRKGVVGKFVQAKAVSPETARKPSSIGVRELDLDQVRRAARRGLLVATGDGRYYVDLNVYRRQRRRINAAFIVAGAILLVLTGLALLKFIR